MVVPLTALTESDGGHGGVRRRRRATRSVRKTTVDVGGVAEDGVQIAADCRLGTWW